MFKTFPWPAQKTATSYEVGIGVEGMKNILEKDRIEPNLYDVLSKIDGVADVEYDGHFGPFVYFSVVSNVDNEATHIKILEVIKEFISDD